MFLLIFRSDEGVFDKDDFLALFFSRTDLTEKGGPSIGCLVSGRFEFQEYSTLVRFGSNLQVIVLSSENPAAYEMAVRLQRACNVPLRLVDEGTSFDLELKNYQTAEELAKAIDKAREGYA